MYSNLVGKLSSRLVVADRKYKGSHEEMNYEFDGRDETSFAEFIGSAETFAHMVDTYISQYESKSGSGQRKVDGEIYENFALIKNPKVKSDYESDPNKLRKYLKSSRDEIEMEDEVLSDSNKGASIFDIATPISKYIINK